MFSICIHQNSLARSFKVAPEFMRESRCFIKASPHKEQSNLCAAGLRLLSKDFSQVWASHHRRKLMSGNFFPFAAEVFGRAPRTVTVWASSLYFHEYHYDKLPFVITLGRISSSEHAPHRQHSTTWNSFPITIITEKAFHHFSTRRSLGK